MSQTFAKRLSTGILAGFVTIVLLAGSPAWSQDPADEGAPAEESADDADDADDAAGAAGEGSGEPASAEAEGDEGGPAVGLDEIPELDRQTHEQDDDDFVPTEEIPVDQSIPFPTDI